MRNLNDHSTASENNRENNPFPDMKQMDVFKTPDGYFEKLPGEISKQRYAASSRESAVTSMFPRFAIAAALAIALLTTGVIYFIGNSESQADQNMITYDDLIQSGLADEIDDQILIDHYFTDNTSENTDSSEVIIDEYLLNGDIDITLIINEL